MNGNRKRRGVASIQLAFPPSLRIMTSKLRPWQDPNLLQHQHRTEHQSSGHSATLARIITACHLVMAVQTACRPAFGSGRTQGLYERAHKSC